MERRSPAEAGAQKPWAAGVTGGVFLLIAALVCVDFLGDSERQGARLHAGIELTLMAVAVIAAVFFWFRFVALRRRERLLVGDLDRARAESDRWRAEANELLRGLGAAIDVQFERWDLSAAERDVALLLLKGLALKEIADLRSTSERTVRQQALAVYRKAGLSGRAELSAFFLEDLLLPVDKPARARG